jgi:hypothetical protein
LYLNDGKTVANIKYNIWQQRLGESTEMSPSRKGADSRSDCVGFMVDNAQKAQVFSSSPSYHSTYFYTLVFIIRGIVRRANLTEVTQCICWSGSRTVCYVYAWSLSLASVQDCLTDRLDIVCISWSNRILDYVVQNFALKKYHVLDWNKRSLSRVITPALKLSTNRAFISHIHPGDSGHPVTPLPVPNHLAVTWRPAVVLRPGSIHFAWDT